MTLMLPLSTGFGSKYPSSFSMLRMRPMKVKGLDISQREVAGSQRLVQAERTGATPPGGVIDGDRLEVQVRPPAHHDG
jgi:hypothetical protein